MVNLLVDHFEARTNVIVERYKFHSIKQAEFQPTKDFVIHLRNQAAKCKYGNNVDDMVRDQLIIGIYNEGTRKRLLANPKLTLQQAIDTLVVEEQVEQDDKCFRPKIIC